MRFKLPSRGAKLIAHVSPRRVSSPAFCAGFVFSRDRMRFPTNGHSCFVIFIWPNSRTARTSWNLFYVCNFRVINLSL